MLGLGATGLSMARWLSARGASVRVADTREAPPNAAQLQRELPAVELHTGAFRPESFAGVNLIAISPGVARTEALVRAAIDRGIEVVGDIELFARIRDEFPNGRVIAITGSNGKSTVTEMVGAMVRAAKIRTLVAGNIGVPILDAMADIAAGINRRPDVFVLELSSFQLDSTRSLNPEAATVLNVSEDHLDRYSGMDEYTAAKASIFLGAGIQVVNRDDDRVRAMIGQGSKVFSFGSSEPWKEGEWGLRHSEGRLWLAEGRANLMAVSDLKVAGRHNAMNALAALALCRALRLPYEPLLEALFNFDGLPHRVQRITEVRGVTFYDDSKGTNVGATVAALMGLGDNIVLIAGGDGKGQDFSPLCDAVARKAKGVVVMGRDAASIAQAIAPSGVRTMHAADMHDAVRAAFALATPGDAVMLSPACASFDMFRNYEHRAEVFVEQVQLLEAEQ